MEQLLLEVCVESARAAALAEQGGADRIELCRDLAAEGLTPGPELLRETRSVCGLPVFAMVRPRPGDFRADEDELARMEHQVDRLAGAGVDGLVFGLLSEDDRVEARSVERLVARAGGLPVTFHRAFDRVPDPLAALETLAELGVARVLTSGGAPTALEGVELLAELVERAAGRLVVMPGGNVRAENAAELRRRTGARELHSSAGGEAGISAEGVRALKAAGSSAGTMSELVAAIDQGTTSTRCMLVDAAGAVVASAQMEHAQILPRPGWVEHDPLEILRNTLTVCREVAGAGEVVALGITNQRETVVCWNRETGEPFGNAIVWQDTRTMELCERLAREGGPDRLREKTGLPLSTYFAGPKVAWALEHVPGLAAAARDGRAMVGTIDSWLIWNLTGGPEGGRHVTDVTNASRTLLMDLRRLEWDDEILALLGIPRAALPEIVPSCDAAGWGATAAGGPFAGPVPIRGAVGDQQGALVGQGCTELGDVKCTYGTGCFALQNTGTEVRASERGLLTTVAYQLPGQPAVYALEGSVAVAGSLVQWLRDEIGILESAPEIEDLARSVEDSGGVVVVPAFSGLFAPRWRADARGVICGLTRHTNRAHLARAALEAVCHQARDVLDAMREDSGLKLTELRVDGGMVANDLLMQLQADLLDVPIVRAEVLETTALGAAYLAGLATGFYPEPPEHRAQRSRGRGWRPALDASTRERMRSDWERAVERSLGWVETSG